MPPQKPPIGPPRTPPQADPPGPESALPAGLSAPPSSALPVGLPSGPPSGPQPAGSAESLAGTPPMGPEIDATPRPLPARMPIRGRYVSLEPLHRRHVSELWRAAQGADASWTYMSYGPFASEAALAREVMEFASQHDPMVWAVRPVTTGEASGWLSLGHIQPGHASIELGNIWFSPRLQRTRAATEAIFLLLKLAADDLGYRRLVWKCNALNAPSHRAAQRLGFTYEGRHRMHMVSRGRSRDTDWYSIVADEWPLCRDALLGWLDPANFGVDGTAIRGLAEIRADLSA